ncbi:MAG: hypothetical protein MUO26_06510 [Methanotrichaceae archaeon]|nr:hypothetical protein [Methanotrichaceae archaeon]
MSTSNSSIDAGSPKTENKEKLTVGQIFSDSLDLYKANPVIIIPSLIPVAYMIVGALVLGFLIAGMTGLSSFYPWSFDSQDLILMPIMGTMGLFMLIFVLGFMVALILANGVTIEMVKAAFEGGKAYTSLAWESVKEKLQSLLVASILVGILIILGFLLLILPGIVLYFLLYFVAQTIIIDKKGAAESLSASYKFIAANLIDAVQIVLISVALSFITLMIPYLGILLNLIVTPFVISLATIFYIDRRRYREIK